MEKITTDTILSFLKDAVESKRVLNPEIWLDAAYKLAILAGDENDKLFNLQQEVAQMRSGLIMEGKSVAEARVRVEATDKYVEAQKQKAKVELIKELVRIAKIQARNQGGY